MSILQPPASGVKVRMYRQGLGDCFLLAFPTETPEQAFYMLIDCGVVPKTKDPKPIMTKVAQDIEEATGGDIHLLVVTHQHWDHISGFVQAKEVFGRMRIHNLWLAWTENPSDTLAQQLQTEFGKMREALHMALNRASDSRSVAHIANLLLFFGESSASSADGSDNTLGATGISDTETALKAIRDFASTMQSSPDYRYPGEGPLPLPKTQGMSSVLGVRLYVLGPPHDERRLRQPNPNKKKQEVHRNESALTAETALVMALQDETTLSLEERELRTLSFPFDQSMRIPHDEAQQFEFFQTYYGFNEPTQPSQETTAPIAQGRATKQQNLPWRRIDDDWLGTAGDLALDLDGYTNNTCLVLAIELINTGKVLLFVGDAQAGNWLSWDELSWSVTDATDSKQIISIKDLLARTVLYKVGHHGSSNGTILGDESDKRGLELMTSNDLVTMIPVVHTMAVKEGWDDMPFDPLIRRLGEKTHQRIMRIDDPIPKPQPEGMDEATWQAFRANFEETELYMQYTVAD